MHRAPIRPRRNDMRRPRPTRTPRRRNPRIRTPTTQTSPHTQHNPQRHRRRKDRRHTRHDGLDAILFVCRFGYEEEDDVDEVDEGDGAVEVEAVAEHEFPGAEGLGLEALEAAGEGEGEGEEEVDGGCDPVDADPGVLRAGDTALTDFERHRCIKVL